MTEATHVVVGGSSGPRVRHDAPRLEERRRVRIKFRTDCLPGAQKVAAGQHIRKADADSKGWVEVIVYASEVQKLEALVEDDTEGLGRARVSYLNKLKKFVAERTGIAREEIPDSMSEWNEAMRLAEQTFPGSVEAEFYSLNGDQRGIRPFEKVKVVESLEAPLGQQEQMVTQIVKQLGAGQGLDEDKLANALVKAFQAVGIGAPAPGSKPKE